LIIRLNLLRISGKYRHKGVGNIGNVLFGVAIMNVSIEESCTACGLCVDTCPEVFTMGDEFAEVLITPVPPVLEEATQQAADECPVEAIIIE